MNRNNPILRKLKNKNILIFGFGREGQSSYRFIRKHFPEKVINIADKNAIANAAVLQNDPFVNIVTGIHYADNTDEYDIVIKSPGISLKGKQNLFDKKKLSSQTDLFLHAFGSQCIGVTGTKGKSTTASLLFHILNCMEKKTVLAGNIGVPVLDIVDDIQPDTIIVLELSSHQLEFVHASPHIGILLNLFEEHLDHYNSFADYQQAKFNIARYQSPEDYFICHTQDELAAALLKKKKIKSELRGFSLDKDGISKSYVRNNFFCTLQGKKEAKICGITDEFPLQGEHNLLNTTSVIAALSCLPDMDLSRTEEAINSFKCLPHRLEYVGKKGGIIFYNDSISTIPQASIAAVRALKNVNTIILGGFDRGVDYQPLVDFLENSAIEHFIFTGEAGKRMLQLFHKREDKEFLFRETYEEIVALAKSCTKRGGICLLSPAAASYDQFQNFEQRGNRFRKLVLTM